MKISKYPSEDAVNEAIQNDDPMLAVISFDGKSAIVSPLDDAVEHHILLAKAGKQSTDIDKYFRIIFDKSGADWTFICPPDYKGIPFKARPVPSPLSS